jgi:23S rRNA (guanosine2251-2'-O)-methyltransferase
VQVDNGLLFLQDKDLYYIKTTPFLGWFFYICSMEKEHQIFGIRAIIEAIQAGTTVDKVYIQKMRVAN